MCHTVQRHANIENMKHSEDPAKYRLKDRLDTPECRLSSSAVYGPQRIYAVRNRRVISAAAKMSRKVRIRRHSSICLQIHLQRAWPRSPSYQHPAATLPVPYAAGFAAICHRCCVFVDSLMAAMYHLLYLNS